MNEFALYLLARCLLASTGFLALFGVIAFLVR